MPQHPNSLANLEKGKATRFQSGDEAAKAGRNGGIASGKARRALSLPELAEIIGNRKVKSEKAKKVIRDLGVPADSINHDAAVLARILADAENGKVKQIELWLKLRGQYPKDEMTVTNVEAPKVILEDYDDGRGGYE